MTSRRQLRVLAHGITQARRLQRLSTFPVPSLGVLELWTIHDRLGRWRAALAQVRPPVDWEARVVQPARRQQTRYITQHRPKD